MSDAIRERLKAEALACQKDPKRDRSDLSELLDEHAMMGDFDPWADGAVENACIAILNG